MLKKIIFTLTPLCGLLLSVLKAQDPLSSLNYAVPSDLHPSFAGINESYNFGFRLRKYNPVPGIDFSTMAVNTDMPFYLAKQKFGFGLTMSQDKAGGLNTSYGLGTFAYDAPLGGIVTGHHLRSGVQFMLTNKFIDYGKVKFEDQYTSGGNFNAPSKDFSTALDNDFNFDMNFGILYYKSNPPGKESKFLPYLGVVMRRVSFSEKKNFGDPGDISSKYTIMGGADWRFSKSMSLKPGIIYFYQNGREMIAGDLCLEISLPSKSNGNPGALVIGSTFRNEDAAVTYIGLEYKNVKVAFASDYSMSDLNPGEFGAYEISIGFYLDRNNATVSSFEKSETGESETEGADTDRTILPFSRF